VSVEQSGLPASPPLPAGARTQPDACPLRSWAPDRVVLEAGGVGPCPPRSKDAVVAPITSQVFVLRQGISAFSLCHFFFFVVGFCVWFFFFPHFLFRRVFGSVATGPSGARAAPSLGVARGGRGEERGGLTPAAPRSRSAGPAPGSAGVGGQGGTPATPQRGWGRNASVPAPTRSPAQPRSRLGCPGEPRSVMGEPRGVMAARGLFPVGGRCWRGPGSLPCARPVQLPGPARVASCEAARPGAGEPQPCPRGRGRAVAPP